MKPEDSKAPVPAKRPYEPPTFTPGQSLAAVTAAKKKLSSGEEKPVFCWVARAVYGDDNPRWLLFRAWMIEDAPAWLRAAYIRYGSGFAPVVGGRPWLAALLRRFMDRAIAAKFPVRDIEGEVP